MRPLDDMDERMLAHCRVVLTDIDDTLTTDGQLSAAAYSAVERLAQAGLAVVPVTGRPAGWCDMIARFWPVAGVVGENGAFYFAYDRSAKVMRQRFFTDETERRRNRTRLDTLRDHILKEVPGAGIASDQLYRVADLAIDYCEDVPALSHTEVQRIIDLFARAGAAAKLSSIHVNGWFGSYDKLSMTRIFAADILGLDIDAENERVIFVGDSPNDGPMFGFFVNSCGVANVHQFDPSRFSAPAYVTEAKGGSGFVQIAERILCARTRICEKDLRHG